MAAGLDAKAIFNLLMGIGMGALGGGAGGFTGGIGSFGGGGHDVPDVDRYPTEFAPDTNHIYPVAYIKGAPQLNAVGKGFSNTIDEAAEQQTLKEHRDALYKYLRMLPKNATPRQIRDAAQMGRDEEKKLPKWWNESNNRREFKVSSSAVSGIRVTPEGNVEVEWGSKPGTWYTFRQYGDTQKASEAARKLLKADSIGRAVYPVQKHGGAPFASRAGIMLGEWNAPNYAAGYAK